MSLITEIPGATVGCPRRLLTPLLVLSFATAGAAGQRDQGGGPPLPPSIMAASPVLRTLDADQDHTVSKAELANASTALRTLDKNADGTLTRDEAGLVLAGRGGRGRAGGREPEERPAPGPSAEDLLSMLMTFDKNKDGKLERSEVPDRQAGIFERGDSNADGVLDSDELKKLTAQQAAAPVAPPRAGGRGRGGFGRFDLAFAALDTNSDGRISADEISGAAIALKALDKNNDGRITEDEVTPAGNGRGEQR